MHRARRCRAKASEAGVSGNGAGFNQHHDRAADGTSSSNRYFANSRC